ncbi:MAG TPA: hypothetical protein VF658_03535 [Pyrinomonadaceae bacterium]
MQDSDIRYLNMGRRVDDFNVTHNAAFPLGSRGNQLIVVIRAAVTAMETAGGRQDAAERDWQEATAQKEAARLVLLQLLRIISRTARGMRKLMPGIAEQFRMPRTYSDQLIINAARAFLAAATPIPAEFIKRGLAADFLTTLESAITEFESAIDRQNTARGEQTTATAAINDARQQLIDAITEYSPIVLNTFATDATVRVAWKKASRVERAPKRAKKTPPPTPTPAPTS